MIYEISTSWTETVEADDEKEAEEKFIELVEGLDSNWWLDNIEIKRVRKL